MKTSLVTLLAAGTLCAATAHGATLLTGTSLYGSKTTLPTDFGSNIVAAATGIEVTTDASGIIGTPDVVLSWIGSTWKWHSWGGANSFQMEGSSAGSTFSILFTPTATTGVVLNSFDFIGDTNNNIFKYTVELVDTLTSLTVWSLTTEEWTVSDSDRGPAISVGYIGDIGTAYRLDITAVTVGGTGGTPKNNIAIDNISFAQIPEPSTYALGAAGLLGALVLLRRRRK